jgi:hypothetical protein
VAIDQNMGLVNGPGNHRELVAWRAQFPGWLVDTATPERTGNHCGTLKHLARQTRIPGHRSHLPG